VLVACACWRRSRRARGGFFDAADQLVVRDRGRRRVRPWFARAVGAKLGEIVGQQVIVEPRPGANGTLAAELVAAAPADGTP